MSVSTYTIAAVSDGEVVTMTGDLATIAREAASGTYRATVATGPLAGRTGLVSVAWGDAAFRLTDAR